MSKSSRMPYNSIHPSGFWDDFFRYRFSFNGKEKDNETYGEGNEYNYGYRIYDTRIGKWLSLDPLMGKFAHVSAFSYCENNPISITDPSGLYPVYFMIRRYESSAYFGSPMLSAGDDRQTSANVNASARMHHFIGIETNTQIGKNPVIYNNAFSSETTQYLLWPGSGTETPKFSAFGDVKENNDKRSLSMFTFKDKATQPVAKKLDEDLTPDIDTKGFIKIDEDKENQMLKVTGSIKGDNFPDAEGYMFDASGNGISLGDFQHPWYGSPIYSLAGEGSEPLVNFEINIKMDDKGNFLSAYYMFEGKQVAMKIYSPKETEFVAPKSSK